MSDSDRAKRTDMFGRPVEPGQWRINAAHFRRKDPGSPDPEDFETEAEYFIALRHRRRELARRTCCLCGASYHWGYDRDESLTSCCPSCMRRTGEEVARDNDERYRLRFRALTLMTAGYVTK